MVVELFVGPVPCLDVEVQLLSEKLAEVVNLQNERAKRGPNS